MEKLYQLTSTDAIWKCTFNAMASPCEILFSTESAQHAETFAEFAFNETKRIETKFSRYTNDNIIYKINNSHGAKIKVDEETARMLDFAQQCFHLSDGLFDITSGILRNCWAFDGTEQSPDKNKLSSALSLVGWNIIIWEDQTLHLLPGMEIDFGGIGKEYAVDRIADFASSYKISKVMVNFGGDIRTINQNSNSPPWVIGIESPKKQNSAVSRVSMHNGGIATSGNSKRFCLHKGKRLGHILNPKTGWPIENAPRSVTVISDNCIEAGMIATLAILQGKNAEQFLELQKVTYKCIR